MEASRELDKEIALKIMGWDEVVEHVFGGIPNGTYVGHSPNSTNWLALPKYSTNIADCFSLVVQLKQKGYDFEYLYGHSKGNCLVTFVKEDKPLTTLVHLYKFSSEWRDTLALAICEAALNIGKKE